MSSTVGRQPDLTETTSATVHDDPIGRVIPMRLHPPTAAVAVSLTAVLLAACGDADDATSAGQEEPTATTPDSTPTTGTTPTTDRAATPTPTATASPTEVAFATCESDEYAIDHPAAWETNEGDVIEPCRVFHAGDIDLEPQQDRSLHYAVSIYIDPVPFERASEPSGPNEVLSHEEDKRTLDRMMETLELTQS
jgi:hypothetical protein